MVSEYLFSVWPEIAGHFRCAKRILLLTDYDGTLTPIVEKPELAALPQSTKELLQALVRQPRFTAGIVSGRALSDLKNKVAINNIIYAGNHGLEIEGPGLKFIEPLAAEIRPILQIIHEALARSLKPIRGVLVEDKGLTLSVHYRCVEAAQTKELRSIFDRIIAGAQSLGRVRATSGKKVYEVRPAVPWDKGKAVQFLIKRYGKWGKNRLLPLYLGDDLTDEDAFKATEYESGISIFIGEESRETAARYFLRSPEEVGKFLGKLLECMKEVPE